MSQPPQYAQQPPQYPQQPQYGSQYPQQQSQYPQQQQYVQPVTTTVYTDSQPLMASTGVVYVSTPNLWLRRRRAIGCFSFFLTLIVVIITIAAIDGWFHYSVSECYGSQTCYSTPCDQHDLSCPSCGYGGYTCNQRFAYSPTCPGVGSTCDQAYSTKPSCGAGDCNQQGATNPRCSGGYCCQYLAAGGSCSGGFCGYTASSSVCTGWINQNSLGANQTKHLKK